MAPATDAGGHGRQCDHGRYCKRAERPEPTTDRGRDDPPADAAGHRRKGPGRQAHDEPSAGAATAGGGRAAAADRGGPCGQVVRAVLAAGRSQPDRRCRHARRQAVGDVRLRQQRRNFNAGLFEHGVFDPVACSYTRIPLTNDLFCSVLVRENTALRSLGGTLAYDPFKGAPYDVRWLGGQLTALPNMPIGLWYPLGLLQREDHRRVGDQPERKPEHQGAHLGSGADR